MYASNLEVSRYIKQLLADLKGETDKNTIIVGDMNPPLTAINRPDRKSIRKYGP